MEGTIVSGWISLNKEEVRFESDDIVLVWPMPDIRHVSYKPTHPVDVEAAAKGRVEAMQSITLSLAMDSIPEPAISIHVDDPLEIEDDPFDVRLVFETQYRVKAALKHIEAALDPRYGGSSAEHRDMPTEHVRGKWRRGDRCLGEMRTQLRRARTEEACQEIGLLCRETLVSLAQAVYEPEEHTPSDGVAPSSTDAKRMLDAYFLAELRGRSNEEARRQARAALSLANALQHRRTATKTDALLCAEATVSAVNLVAILAGRHGST